MSLLCAMCMSRPTYLAQYDTNLSQHSLEISALASTTSLWHQLYQLTVGLVPHAQQCHHLELREWCVIHTCRTLNSESDNEFILLTSWIKEQECRNSLKLHTLEKYSIKDLAWKLLCIIDVIKFKHLWESHLISVWIFIIIVSYLDLSVCSWVLRGTWGSSPASGCHVPHPGMNHCSPHRGPGSSTPSHGTCTQY